MLRTNQLAGFVCGGVKEPLEFVGAKAAVRLADASGSTALSLSSGLAGGIDTGVAAGDLVIGIYALASNAGADRTLSVSDGTNAYSVIGSELYTGKASNGTNTNLRVACKRMEGSPDASVTFGPTSNAGNFGIIGVLAFRNANAATPLDITPATATSSNGIDPNPPAITPVTPGAKIVVVGACAGATFTLPSSFTTPADLDLFPINLSYESGSSDQEAALGAGIKNWVSGAFDPAVFDFSIASSGYNTWAALTFAIRPA